MKATIHEQTALESQDMERRYKQRRTVSADDSAAYIHGHDTDLPMPRFPRRVTSLRFYWENGREDRLDEQNKEAIADDCMDDVYSEVLADEIESVWEDLQDGLL